MVFSLKTEVLVTGTFNVLHAGHVRLFEFASRYGKVTVGINSDLFLRNKYGDQQTVGVLDRSYVIRTNQFVDKVVVFSENEPSSLIKKLKPAFVIKGPDYKDVELPEQDAINLVGAKLIIQPIDKEYNSKDLVKILPKSSFKIFDEYN